MTAQQQLHERIAALPEADVAVLAGFVDDALPPQFRAVPPQRAEERPRSREQLLGEVEALTEGEACEILEYLDWITSDEPEDLSAEELEDVRRGQEELARGKGIPWDEVKRELGL